MKKKNLKSLSLDKTVISNLDQNQVNGGTGSIIGLTAIWCPSDTCITTVYSGPLKPSCGNC